MMDWDAIYRAGGGRATASPEDIEARRWQDRIADVIRRAGLEPHDASGNESGDPLDWSADQVRRALDDIVEQRDAAREDARLRGTERDAMRAQRDALREALVNIKRTASESHHWTEIVTMVDLALDKAARAKGGG